MLKHLLIVLLLISIFACKDDGGSKNYLITGFEEDRSKYEISIFQVGEDAMFYVSKVDETDMQSVELEVNGQTVEVDLSSRNYYCYGSIESNYGDTLSISCLIDSTDEINVDFVRASEFQNISYPETYDPSSSYPISWDLDNNPDELCIWGSYFIDDESGDKYKMLDSSDRGVTLPANWLPSSQERYTDYYLSLGQLVYFLNDVFWVYELIYEHAGGTGNIVSSGKNAERIFEENKKMKERMVDYYRNKVHEETAR